MKAVILCAGLGTRLRPLTNDTPKVMLPINEKPVLHRHIEYHKKYGITDMYINLHYLPQKIRSYLDEEVQLDVGINYSYEKELRGTAGALNGFREQLSSTQTEPFIVHYGDVISEVNLSKMASYHNKKGAVATLVVHPTDHPEDSDIVVLDENDSVTKLHHKPGTSRYGKLGNAGLYILEPGIFDYLPKEGNHDFTQDLFPKLVQEWKPVHGYRTDEFIKDMGTPERYKKVQRRYEED